jgi:hypothetical protein
MVASGKSNPGLESRYDMLLLPQKKISAMDEDRGLNNEPDDQIYFGERQYLRTFTLAEVRQCRELQDEFSTHLRLGVKNH